MQASGSVMINKKITWQTSKKKKEKKKGTVYNECFKLTLSEGWI